MIGFKDATFHDIYTVYDTFHDIYTEYNTFHDIYTVYDDIYTEYDTYDICTVFDTSMTSTLYMAPSMTSTPATTPMSHIFLSHCNCRCTSSGLSSRNQKHLNKHDTISRSQTTYFRKFKTPEKDTLIISGHFNTVSKMPALRDSTVFIS
ncbi:hypothetical protein EMCRGX_G030492 [Ephydatia muelleri]